MCLRPCPAKVAGLSLTSAVLTCRVYPWLSLAQLSGGGHSTGLTRSSFTTALILEVVSCTGLTWQFEEEDGLNNFCLVLQCLCTV